MENRVGGWPLVGQPTSHTTVRTVRYTAVPKVYTLPCGIAFHETGVTRTLDPFAGQSK